MTKVEDWRKKFFLEMLRQLKLVRHVNVNTDSLWL